jgi:hypothetical protein
MLQLNDNDFDGNCPVRVVISLRQLAFPNHLGRPTRIGAAGHRSEFYVDNAFTESPLNMEIGRFKVMTFDKTRPVGWHARAIMHQVRTLLVHADWERVTFLLYTACHDMLLSIWK